MKRTLLATVAITLVAAPAAAAHVTANPNKAPANSFAMIAFRVPHGCEDSPTTSLTIRIPDGVVSVTPEAVPGWKVRTVTGKLAEAVELHGETITEGVKTVTWSGGRLDAHQFSDFGISMRLPDRPAGTKLHFPAIQRCAQGVTRWIQIPVEGEEEPDEPAPELELVAAADGEGADDAAQTGDEETAATDSGPTEGDDPVAASDNDRANLALGLAGAGLLAGLAALAASLWRRPRRV